MIILVLSFILSLVPVIILYLYLKNKMIDDASYKEMCKKSIIAGALDTLPILLCSFIFVITKNIIFKDNATIWAVAFHNFFVLAFSEELVKMLSLFYIRKKNNYKCSFIETMSFMAIIGIGFEILESMLYAITTNPIEMFVRGITMMHAAFGMLMGYYIAKAEKDNNKVYYILAFVLPWLLHGIYDFSLNEEFLAINDNLAFVPFIVILITFIIIIRFLLFIRKNKNNESYLTK